MANPAYITKYASNKPPTTFNEIYRNSEMWIINMETMCLDFPRVHGYHYKFIGGLGCEPAKPLPKEMEDFAFESKNHGIIILTFGSGLSHFPEDMMTKLMTAFKVIPQRVFMRYEGTIPADKPDNVFLSKWLPQNDLLGHPKTKLFITHGGNNGQLEGLYHGVPLLTMPFCGDQLYSGQRSSIHGYGLVIDPKTFTPDELVSDIKEIISNPKYKENIKHCSEIFHSLPSPQDELIFWVNHVLKFGGSHLKPQYIDMPLWQFFMFDIAAFLLVILILSMLCAWCCCQTLWKRCREQGALKGQKATKE